MHHFVNYQFGVFHKGNEFMKTLPDMICQICLVFQTCLHERRNQAAFSLQNDFFLSPWVPVL